MSRWPSSSLSPLSSFGSFGAPLVVCDIQQAVQAASESNINKELRRTTLTINTNSILFNSEDIYNTPLRRWCQ